MAIIRKIFLTSLAVFGLLFLAASVVYAAGQSAATETAAPVETSLSAEATQAVEASASLADEPQALEGVTVKEPAGIPSNFGLFWRNLRERISLALTFDPVKKAEKSLKFAEERVKLAAYIIQNSGDPKVQEKAQKALDKANQYIQRVEERQDNLLKNAGERAKTLMSNLAWHYANKERVLEKMEDKLPLEKLEKFQQFRQQVEDKQGKILEALANNSNLPAEVKQKIKQVKENVQAKLQNRQEFRVEQKDILDKIKAGNQAAREQLETLRQEKLQSLEQARQLYKVKMQEIIDQIKAGQQGAVEKLKQLNQQRQREMSAQGESLPAFTKVDMEQGWYWGDANQKKPGTPSPWLYRNAGTRSAQWYDPSR